MDRLAAMQTLVEVADAGSFSAAARAMAVTPAAVSKSIARLEQQLEVRLVQRTTRVSTLTDAGAEYVARCRQILADVGAAQQALERTARVPSGTLRLTAPALFGRRCLMPIVLAYMRRWPAVRVDVFFTDEPLDVVLGGVDLAIRFAAQLPDSSLSGRRIGRVRRHLVGSRVYFERHGVPASPRALAEHRCLMRRGPEGLTPWALGRHVVRPGASLRPALVLDDTEALHDAVRAHAGIADLPDYLVADGLRRGSLRSILGDHPLPAQDIWLLRPSRELVPLRTSAFVELLERRL